ncbi:MAG: endonuclease III [Candidatus Thermoplasmatota archaeon]|jgi:endonuclease-3|nr:endonuclease III [Euryarchaeota archaeon]MEC7743755.1 endonuclease III [Candidatus Thermoplasmatota archaeon]MED5274197.1 endonuclease III [Candidatus Thermoplasmatota archaeon]|tara:strand:- start:5997 stop:6647 length:651 start_codon:yes stop_codon:yes gene_type:complete
MKRSEKAIIIGELLDEMYPETPIPLDHDDPYTLLVAVMLSAQTTDKKVNEVTPQLFSAANTPQEMMKLEVSEIQHHIRQIGLAPTKARNLKRMAQQIVLAGGEITPDWEFLESLAGVGHKTASVVMSQAFGIPAFPVDTHIHRLASRWGLSDGRSVEKTERDLKRVFPRDTWNRRHLQIIYFGREHCPARRHDMEGCPICSWASTKKRKREEKKKW